MAAPVEIAPPPPEASPSDPSTATVDAFGVPRTNLFTSYNPKGAAGGLFAPAYIHGYAPSEQAVANWGAQKGGLTHENVTGDLRMPDVWFPDEWEPTPDGGVTPAGNFPGDGVYGGGNIPKTLRLGKDPRGTVDVEALRALSHGTPYDVAARRDAIADRLVYNKAREDNWKLMHPEAPQLTRGQEGAGMTDEERRAQEVFMNTQFKTY